jgi:hypothetical protein
VSINVVFVETGVNDKNENKHKVDLIQIDCSIMKMFSFRLEPIRPLHQWLSVSNDPKQLVRNACTKVYSSGESLCLTGMWLRLCHKKKQGLMPDLTESMIRTGNFFSI